MTLSDRQRDILESVVQEYVRKAFPISSQLLEEEYEFSSATIRNELQVLTEEGYLFQPHVSAGRVPTEKGYRFLVNEFLEEIPQPLEGTGDIFSDHFSLMQQLSKASSGLALAYTSKGRVFWKEGWEGLLQEPEFQEVNYIKSLTQFLRDMEDHIEELRADHLISLYIGRENPFSKVKDFSMIFSVFSAEPQGVVAIVGPKRMAYDRNIATFKELLYGKR